MISFVYDHPKKFSKIIDIVDLFNKQTKMLVETKNNDCAENYYLLLADVNLKSENLIKTEYQSLFNFRNPRK